MRARWLLYPIAAFLIVTVLPVLWLRFVPPTGSAYMLEQHLDDLAHGRHLPIAVRWTPWTRISPAMRLAVVASEDQTFPTNWGFDFRAIRKALTYNADHQIVHGASTITQQTARNLFLWPSRTWLRKGAEVYFTVLLELFWPKQRILEVYLNIAQFGDHLYGVGAAAPRFFHRSPADLDEAQAALLAAVLPDPLRMHADRPSPYVLGRAADIRQQMAQLGSGYLDGLH
jgi:monofunctional biosynthetic peptidoglycan transglycosylase